MTQQGVTHVAMEFTGVYWKPIYNILEGRSKSLQAKYRIILADFGCGRKGIIDT